MRKSTSILLVLGLFLALFLFQGGCSSDDDNGTVAKPCSISLVTPEEGDIYNVGDLPENSDPIDVRWTKTGNETHVWLDLLKDGVVVAEIKDRTANDGYYPWRANVMGELDGPGFSIRVMASESCGDTTESFTITDTENCAITFTMVDPEVPLNAGEDFDVTWTSNNTTGSVALELIHSDEIVETIVLNMSDSGTYTWTVDSYNNGSDTGYYLRIRDADEDVPCSALSFPFEIIDNEICAIDITSPVGNAEWTVGESRNIVFTSENNTGLLDITLWGEGQFAGTIATSVDPATGVFAWTVDDLGHSGDRTRFQIKLNDIGDNNCDDITQFFTINATK